MTYQPSFFRPAHRPLLLGASLAINLLALALPLMTMQIYDRVMPNHATDTLLVLSCGVLIAAAAESCLRICRSLITGKSGSQFEHEAGSFALQRLVYADPRQTRNLSASALLQDISSTSRLKDYYSGQMAATLLIDAPFALLFLALAFYLAGPLAYATLGMLAVIMLVMWRQGARLRDLQDQRDAQDDRRYNYMTETLRAIHSVKALCIEAVVARNFSDMQKPSARLTYRISRLQGRNGMIGYFAAQLMTVVVACLGAPLAIDGTITIGMLAACIMLSGQTLQPVMRSLGLWLRLQEIALVRRRFATLTSLPLRPVSAMPDGLLNHDLKIEHVSFSHKSGVPILNDISLTVAQGEIVAIQGASGAGKTTLLELMAGLYTPDRGRVMLGGMDVARLPPQVRGRHVGYLASFSPVLRGSIMDNMTGFDPQQEPAAHELAELLGIEKVVALLPAGYDTPLEGLSSDLVCPGFKQRLSFVRALLHRPRFIIYDNADQGLDRESYNAVFGLLARLKRKVTLVIVSDDRNILSLADQVLELDKGTLTQRSEPVAWLAARRAGEFIPSGRFAMPGATA